MNVTVKAKKSKHRVRGLMPVFRKFRDETNELKEQMKKDRRFFAALCSAARVNLSDIRRRIGHVKPMSDIDPVIVEIQKLESVIHDAMKDLENV